MEFRIGNLIRLPYGGYGFITALMGEDWFEVGETVDAVYVDVIPHKPKGWLLTQEVIENMLGFNELEPNKIYANNVIQLEWDDRFNKWYVYLVGDGNENTFELGVHYEYVHQVQNLFFDVSLEELEIIKEEE